jgi:mannose-1-phosphate guanylyltransferase
VGLILSLSLVICLDIGVLAQVAVRRASMLSTFSNDKPDGKHRWAVVLAGGDGARLQELTHLISGEPLPKQFCNLFGGKSLLGHTRERIDPVFDREHILFALARGHEPYYRNELSDVDDRRKIVQPTNRGTALAMAVCLEAIVREDEDAVVAFFPSDHHYRNTRAFQASVEFALATADEYPQCALVLGAEPTYPEVEYGWIQPGRTLVDSPTNPLQRVSKFWEKPSQCQAEALLGQGCLWNTFVTVGLAGAFLELLQATVPEIARQLAVDRFESKLDEIYRAVPSLDFSRAVFSRVPGRMLLLHDTMSGWTDLGSPRRVIDLLRHDDIPPAWLSQAESASCAIP